MGAWLTLTHAKSGRAVTYFFGGGGVTRFCGTGNGTTFLYPLNESSIEVRESAEAVAAMLGAKAPPVPLAVVDAAA
jgi:hypothetical protein